MLSITAAGISDRYALSGEQISMELAKLLCSVLFDPLFDQGRSVPGGWVLFGKAADTGNDRCGV